MKKTMMRSLFIYIAGTAIIFLILFLYKSPLKTPVPPTVTPSKETYGFPKNRTIATWIWVSPKELGSQNMQKLITRAKEDGINTIYIDISQFVDIYEIQDKNSRDTEMNLFDLAVEEFLVTANANEIAVHALSGNTNWARPSHSYIPKLLLDYVIDFNKKHTQGFAGIHFDIEFYNQGNYLANKNLYDQEFVELVKNLNAKIIKNNSTGGKNLIMGLAISFWMDMPTLGKLAKELNKTPGNYFAIMAYRNKVTGSDSVIELVENELDYVEENAPNVKIVVGQETDVGEGAKTTYRGKTKTELKKNTIDIAERLSTYKAFEGIAIHHFYSYIELAD